MALLHHRTNIVGQVQDYTMERNYLSLLNAFNIKRSIVEELRYFLNESLALLNLYNNFKLL